MGHNRETIMSEVKNERNRLCGRSDTLQKERRLNLKTRQWTTSKLKHKQRGWGKRNRASATHGTTSRGLRYMCLGSHQTRGSKKKWCPRFFPDLITNITSRIK